ncbi:unnamed protein product [Arabidopsis halleri]
MIGLKQKKAHLNEIQINGGDVAKKVVYAHSFFKSTPTPFTISQALTISQTRKL